MRKRKFILTKLLIAFFAIALVFSLVNVKVDATGYTYDHKGKVIYSTEGFTVNQTPYIYETLGISAKTFSEANPSDLYVYSEDDLGAADASFDGTIVYLLDSGGSSKTSTLYCFDEDLNLKREIDYFRYSPATLVANNTDLTMIKSNKTKVVKSSDSVTEYTVKFVDNFNDEETVLATQKVASGASATAVFPGNHDNYYFAGWDTDFSAITEDTTVKAKFALITEEDVVFTATFVDGATSKEIGKVTIQSGTAPIYPTPEEHTGYQFNSWSEDVTSISKDVTITAKYDTTYTVTFKDVDDQTLSTQTVLSGSAATAPYAPFIDKKVFTGWDTEFSKVESELTIKPVYEDDNDAITVSFVDKDGNEIAKYNVKSGEDAVFPTAPALDGFTFSSWDSDGKNITEATTIKALYTQQDNGLSYDTLLAQSEMVLYMCGANSIYRGVSSNTYPSTDYLYICDTSNNQVLVIDATSYQETEKGKGTYEIVQIITSPVSEIGSTTFSPLKVVNDAAGRVYTICEGIEDGILEFSKTGSFDRYVGTNYVTLSAWEIFTRNFATEAQLDQFTTYQNTTFTSMVYKNNMIYTTSYSIKNSNGTTNDTIMIKKINPSGKDVLRRNGYNVPKGDVTYTTYNDDHGAYGASQFVGITVNEYGVYTVVDNKRGRLFTYDNEGNLLYISGGSGNQLDKINIPIAVQYLGENILVLDSKRKAIIVFEPTDIAKVINQAIECEYKGYSDQAYEYWEEVIQLNANYEYAYVGIGKHYMEATDIEDNYKIAMNYFELGANQVYYSKAFKQYRDAIIKKWFPYVITGIVVLAVGGTVYKKVRRKKLGIKEEEMTGMGDE